MRFVGSALAPRVERVIERHGLLEQQDVVRDVDGKAERDREQAWCLTRLLELRRVGGPHDSCYFVQDGIVKLELVEKRVEAATRSPMREGHIDDVVWLCVERPGVGAYLVGDRV